MQGYLLLIQFARTHALAGLKVTALADIRVTAAAVTAIANTETPLHVGYCAGWGLDEAGMAAVPEALATVAYTRFVLEVGLEGDLQVALAPCLVGYGEIVEILLSDPATRLDDNPYLDCIAAYAGAPCRALVRGPIATLVRLETTHGAKARNQQLLAAFTAATGPEKAFLNVGWRAEPVEATDHPPPFGDQRLAALLVPTFTCHSTGRPSHSASCLPGHFLRT